MPSAPYESIFNLLDVSQFFYVGTIIFFSIPRPLPPAPHSLCILPSFIHLSLLLSFLFHSLQILSRSLSLSLHSVFCSLLLSRFVRSSFSSFVPSYLSLSLSPSRASISRGVNASLSIRQAAVKCVCPFFLSTLLSLSTNWGTGKDARGENASVGGRRRCLGNDVGRRRIHARIYTDLYFMFVFLF